MKKNVAVLMGGVSSEHDISVKTGSMIAGSLDHEKYQVTTIIIDRKGHWKFPGERALYGIYDAIPRLRTSDIDCMVLALHGAFGEDGRIQGMLDVLGIPYIGSGCAASAIAIDKIRCKALVQQVGVPVAKHVVVDRAEWDRDEDAVLRRVKQEVGFPCVAKSPCQGSSLGMAIPKKASDFRWAMCDVLTFDDTAMVEQFVKGTEVTCGVLDVEPGQTPRALPVTEIRPIASAFFDYEAKYTPGASEEITPARISEELTRQVQEIAVTVHQTVGCRTLSRSDFIIGPDGLVWLEVNTLPGMTETSLFPQAAAAVGISFPKLLEMFVDSTLSGKGK